MGEFKKVQKLMKEGRRLGGVHAGLESKVLDGLSWEEVKNMQDAQTSQVDGYGGMKIGAASKGIIQRDFQHHATVFKSPYAKNPFDSVSNDELEEYKRIIDKKQRGETSPVIEDPGDTTDPGNFSIHVILPIRVIFHPIISHFKYFQISKNFQPIIFHSKAFLCCHQWSNFPPFHICRVCKISTFLEIIPFYHLLTPKIIL